MPPPLPRSPPHPQKKEKKGEGLVIYKVPINLGLDDRNWHVWSRETMSCFDLLMDWQGEKILIAEDGER